MIGDRLRLARRKANCSLRDLSAAMAGRVTAQAIGKYERGESVPSSGVLLALSKALGVSLNYLMDTQGIQLAGVEFRTKANTGARDRAKVETEVLRVDRALPTDRNSAGSGQRRMAVPGREASAAQPRCRSGEACR